MSWTPTRLASGWQRMPFLSPDGRYVVYGFGEVWLVDLLTGVETLIGSKAVGNWFPCGYWGDRAIIRCEVGGNADYQQLWAVSPDGTLSLVAADPQFVAGAWVVAADGHWASSVSNGRTVYDGRVLSTTGGLQIAVNGPQLVAESWHPDDTIDLVRYEHGVLMATTRAQNTATQVAIADDGTVCYGGHGPVRLLYTDGRDVDATVTPWRWEAEPTFCRALDGLLWLWCHAWHEQVDYVVGRPIGAMDAILLRTPGIGLSVCQVGAEWVIAGTTDTGTLTVVRVPVGTPRAVVTMPAPVPVSTEPVLDTSDQPIDMLAFLVGGEWPHTSRPNDVSGVMDCLVDLPGRPRTITLIKWQDPPSQEVLRYDDVYLFLHEDRTDEKAEGGKNSWHLTDGRWTKRFAHVGDVIDCRDNHIQRFHLDGTKFEDSPWRYIMTVEAHYSAYPFGGDVGTREAVRVRFDPTWSQPNNAGAFERFYYAKGWGEAIWESRDFHGEALQQEARMIYRGGQRVSPVPLIVPLPGETPVPSTPTLPTGVPIIYPDPDHAEVPVLRMTGTCPIVTFSVPGLICRAELVNGSIYVELDAASDGHKCARSGRQRLVKLEL